MSRRALALALAVFAPSAAALEVAAGDCREAAQFIGNAARARDNGIGKAAFVARFDEDVVILDSIPAAQRWFVHGPAEAEFLRAAIVEVFDAPRAPIRHSADFLAACLQHVADDSAG